MYFFNSVGICWRHKYQGGHWFWAHKSVGVSKFLEISSSMSI